MATETKLKKMQVQQAEPQPVQEPQQSPESVSESPAPSIDEPNGDFPEIDTTLYDEPEPLHNVTGEDGVMSDDETPEGCLTKEQFFVMVFCPLHNLPAAYLRLESLPIRKAEMEAARQASDAIYDCCADVESMHWLINPSNVWMQRAVCIGAFVVPKGMAVKAELVQRKQEKMRQQQEAQEAQERKAMEGGQDGGE